MKIAAKLLVIAALAFGAPASAADAPGGTLEMRLVVDCKPRSVALPYDRQGTTENLCLSPDRVFDRSDIVDAQVVHTVYGTDTLRITIGTAAATRMGAATTGHVGGRMAIVYNGKIVSAPIIQEPITGDAVEIDMGSGMDSDDLDAVVAGLRAQRPQ